ncbi:MAG: hypothetical protein GY788_17645 [bacterium]|nr:hypothetical protein [bacterium]
MANWVLGKRRYDAADVSNHAEMRATAELMCGSLAEGIRGRLIFPAQSKEQAFSMLGQTTWDVLVAVLQGNTAQTFDDVAQRQLRVGAASTRRGGWQPRNLGGDGTMDEIFDNLSAAALMKSALGALAGVEPSFLFDIGAWFKSA